MKRQRAEEFEEALHLDTGRAPGDEELASLVQVARQVGTLAEAPPPAPHRLQPGRQQFLAEAARLRAAREKRQMGRQRRMAVAKLAAALAMLVLLSGLVFGAGQAVADSLPGDPLYTVKIRIEYTRMALTGDPQARAALSLAFAAERMDEVEGLLAQQRPVTPSTAGQVRQQLVTALNAAAMDDDAVASAALQRLATTIQERQRIMEPLAGDPPDEPVRQVLRAMEQVRSEALAGVGDPAGLRRRLRTGTPPGPGDAPGQNEPQPGEQLGPQGPQPTVEPGEGPGPGPQPTVEPGEGPGPGPQPTVEPGQGPGPGPQPTVEPGEGPGPGPQPTVEPGQDAGPGPQPTVEPGEGPSPGPQPTVEPGEGPGPGPQPTVEPGEGPGPGPQPTVEPGEGPGPGPQPTVEPGEGPGPGTQPAMEPEGGTSPGSQPAPSPTGTEAGSQSTTGKGP